MSHIFEALKRAEAERSGGHLSGVPDSIAELLESSLADVDASESPRTIEIRAGAMETSLLSGARTIIPTPPTNARLVCLTEQGSLAAEKFRVLGLRLRNLREKRQLKRIVVTSTIPEEGKTLTSANLALNQSRGKTLKTVLIDGDLRRPSLASRFGLSRSLAGLAECLRGEKQLSEVLCKLQNANLWLLPSGDPPENPMELMQSGRLVDLLDRLGNVFDWIIIDCPPVIPLADTSFWMKVSDGVLLVVREGVSEKRPLKRALEIIDHSTLLGVVVNSCSSQDHKSYYQRYKALSASPGETSSPANE